MPQVSDDGQTGDEVPSEFSLSLAQQQAPAEAGPRKYSAGEDMMPRGKGSGREWQQRCFQVGLRSFGRKGDYHDLIFAGTERVLLATQRQAGALK